MSPFTAIGSVVLLMGLASLAAFSWALRKWIHLERAADAGDFVVLGVLAAFGLFCIVLGWRIVRTREASPTLIEPAAPPRRVTVSQGIATAGVVLLMLSVLVPAEWYPVVLLFGGLALLAVSHVLTPCQERIEKLRRARASVHQL
jgi:formate hydrogenlyase subunit 3/multisubunit Na+/H+ antiporter MnhD subunit